MNMNLPKVRLWFLHLLLITLFGFCSQFANAQPGYYSLTATTSAYTPISGTSVSLSGGPDEGYTATNIPIGFTFNYIGINYLSIGVSTNGFATLTNIATAYPDNDLANSFSVMFSRPVLAPLWDDLALTGASDLQYSTTGSAGSRVFIIQWSNVKWDRLAAAPVLSFQLRLYETTNVIEFSYQQLGGGVSGTSGGASIGLTNSGSGAGNYMSLSDSGPSPATSSSVSTNNITALPANNQLYRFTPIPCNAPVATVAATYPNGADVAWPVVPGVTGYEWAVIPASGSAPTSGTLISTNSVSITGLSPNQWYYVYVRSRCGVSYSSWSSKRFSTVLYDVPCSAAPLTLGGPAVCADVTNADYLGDPGYSCFPPVPPSIWFSYTPAITGLPTFRIRRDPSATTHFRGSLQLYKVTGTCPFITLTQNYVGQCMIQSVDLSTQTEVQAVPQYGVLPAGTTYYLLAVGTGKLCVDIPQSCTQPIYPALNATAVPVPGNQVTLSWVPVSTATSYDVTISPSGGGLPIQNFTTTSTSQVVPNLVGSTTYSWIVVPKDATNTALGCGQYSTFYFTTVAVPGYCTPQYGSGAASGDSIGYFSLKGAGGAAIYDETGAVYSSSPNSYSNFTGSFPAVTLARGESFGGFLRAGRNDDYATMWIDANDDGVFATDEMVMRNMPLSTTKKHYSVYIPAAMNTGTHRMRLRAVRYADAGTPFTFDTHPCTYYDYGETEDYLVNITSTPTVRQVSPGVPGTCWETSITVPDGQLWATLVDSSNNVLGALRASASRKNFTLKTYVNPGPVRADPTGKYYLDRNFTVKGAVVSGMPFSFRMYYLSGELSALAAVPTSGVSTDADLNVTKTIQDSCSAGIGINVPLGALLIPSARGSFGTERYLDIDNLLSFSTFYLHGGTVALPVRLLSFAGEREGSVNRLRWTTASELNSRDFDVQRSADGITYESIGFVNSLAPGGNSAGEISYSFTDNNAGGRKWYYRLRLHDLDGRNSLSNVIIVRGDKPLTMTIEGVFPNPANTRINVMVAAPVRGRLTLVITDMSGKPVLQQLVNAEAGSNSFSLDISRLAGGSYIVKLLCDNCETAIGKFVKQ